MGILYLRSKLTAPGSDSNQAETTLSNQAKLGSFVPDQSVIAVFTPASMNRPEGETV